MAVNLSDALNKFSSVGISIKDDFHTLTSAQVEVILQCAKDAGYKKPINANGSTARMYFQALQRKYSQRE